ncbi:MAG: ParB/RepB/Spo0J family partition protein [Lachnospiraceae bacterium]|nr:ParB/RepB/Spo0J family partition protein [Ruminococcus sp.]MCM1274777.1 ParB/RepB/Spo0J family partition protein [Lachnospiraceae bacterium]
MPRKTESSFNDLFFDNSVESAENGTTLRLSEIEPNKEQPRKSFDNESLRQLAESITEHGVLQPLIVQSLPSGNYRIIAGERRWRAAKMAGLSEIPVIVRDDITEEQAMQIAMIENLQRENLNPIEEALGYKELIDKYDMTQDKLAKVLGKARSSIANSLGLLAMPNGVQELLRGGSLSAGHCKALKKIKDEALMIELAHKTAEGELSVRQVEAIAKRETQRMQEEYQGKTREIKPRMTYYTEVEVSLTEQLGTKVKISEGKKGNVLQINFADKDQLEGILKHFQEN